MDTNEMAEAYSVLYKPINPKLIKEREEFGGAKVDGKNKVNYYIQASTAIDILNQLPNKWNFIVKNITIVDGYLSKKFNRELITEKEVDNYQVGKNGFCGFNKTRGKFPKLYAIIEEPLMINPYVWATCALEIEGLGVREHMGTNEITSSVDTAIKGAVSDALKKTATMFGVASQLYEGSVLHSINHGVIDSASDLTPIDKALWRSIISVILKDKAFNPDGTTNWNNVRTWVAEHYPDVEVKASTADEMTSTVRHLNGLLISRLNWPPRFI